MLTDRHFKDLKEKGYTVIDDVLRHEECDAAIGQYQQWLSQFKAGTWPFSSNSLIQRYNVGHMEPTWSVRLKTKNVFSQLWKTDKLLTSFDAIAVGRPPEDGEESFHVPGTHWLHLDQNADRVGLHAYQGAVYLEEACEDDWTLQVLEGSHKYFEEFYQNSLKATMRSNTNIYYHFNDNDVDFMDKKGCKSVRVAVPKGGMVLWDSRLVHANANPMKGRQHPGRWRYCVFVCMTPAIWASKQDVKRKKMAFTEAAMTTHWSSQGVVYGKNTIPSFAPRDVTCPTTVPSIARTTVAKQLSGVIPYDFNDGIPNGIPAPAWKNGRPPADAADGLFSSPKQFLIFAALLAAVAAVVGYAVTCLW